ncbi:hypothetical protein OH807_36160 [Kitasatospora sp. NBC_01560]|uniref:pPIWI_RE_Y domain-containing protein n=1 Tax=Kitasatospora sp. NBC_01560 TaxID=2975965 RepID=UPI0038670C58
MARWARERPLSDWPLKLPADARHAGYRLSDPEARPPKQLFLDWEVSAVDPAAEMFENEVGDGALADRAGVSVPAGRPPGVTPGAAGCCKSVGLHAAGRWPTEGGLRRGGRAGGNSAPGCPLGSPIQRASPPYPRTE